MKNYNDGEWHAWNGDWEAPNSIHGMSEVEYIWHDEDNGDIGHYHVDADTIAWTQVLKFRVTDAYIEPPKPRSVWEDDNGYIWTSRIKAHLACSDPIEFREVLK